MTHTLRVVCRPALKAGFALAGVKAIPVIDSAEAGAVLSGLVERPGLGVLFVEEELYSGLPDALRETLERRPLPVVVPFPGPRREARATAESGLVELLRRAIGYRVRLR